MRKKINHIVSSTLLSCTLAACGGSGTGSSAGDSNIQPTAHNATVKAAVTAAAQITSGAVYTLVNPNSGKALDVTAAGTANGTPIDIYAINGTAAQQWKINSNSDGTYTLTNTHSGKVLDVVSAGTANGTGIDIYTPNSTVAQKWQINGNSDGTVTLVNPNSGKALDVAAAGTANGTLVDIYTINGTAAQKWQINPVPLVSMLHTSGRNIVDPYGNVVQLKGVNLGGLFVMEKWMTPLDSNGVNNFPIDTYSAIKLLDQRFGVAAEQSLIKTFQQNYITGADLDNIKNAGFNLIRVPVWWGQFFAIDNATPSGWRSDAFTMLDWLVSNAAARGIYVIIDMHGVVGSQSTDQNTGWAGQNAFWGNQNNQGNTEWMWWNIANHYNGNPAIAGYDLINEPDGAPSVQNDNGTGAVWTAYNSIYNSVRSADPAHMIIMEGTFGSWNWSMLPAPSQYGWTNIMYEMHEYQQGAPIAQVRNGSTAQVTDFNNHATWNVPGYIGEFNDFSNNSADWQFSIQAYDIAGLNWTMWSYKNTLGQFTPGNPATNNSWGWYDPIYWPATPNLITDSAATINSDWQQWQTTSAFGLNTYMGLTP